MMLQAAVSLLNIGSYRLAPAPPAAGGERAAERRRADLEQVRDAIDGVEGAAGDPRAPHSRRAGPLRDALSQLQMAYAREAQAGGQAPAPEDAARAGAAPASPPEPAGAGGTEPAASEQGQQPAEGDATDAQGSRGPGPAESSGRLWVPGR